MDLNDGLLLELAFDAASSDINDVPSSVWDEVVARTGRGATGTGPSDPNWSKSGAVQVSPFSAFIDTASEFGALLGTLDEQDWSARTRVEGTVVRDLVEHLIGMERYLLGQLGQ